MSIEVLPQTYTIKLKDKREVAERTMAFWFERPAGFSFEAGQFAELSLSTPEPGGEQALAFSMASAPEEPDLMFATRLRGGSFKHALEVMPIGGTIKLEGPFGEFTLDESTRPAALIAGGIGITPMRSMLVHATRQHSKRDIILFYSNRRPEDAAFLQELESLQAADPHYHFVPVMTQIEKSSVSWTGETGHLNYNMIVDHTRQYKDLLFYIAGPPRFVRAFRQLLLGNGIAKQDIRSEDFVGY